MCGFQVKFSATVRIKFAEERQICQEGELGSECSYNQIKIRRQKIQFLFLYLCIRLISVVRFRNVFTFVE